MDKFTASNGAHIRIEGPGTDRGRPLAVDGSRVSPNDAQALREFFAHERDVELGRWRSKKHPDWTAVLDVPVDEVRSRQGNGVQAFDVDNRERRYDRWSNELQEVAAEYFAAHPEPKPWHDAKPGEVWVLTGAGGLEQPWRRMDTGRWLSCTTGMVEYNDEHAIAGRRIYPEVSDD